MLGNLQGISKLIIPKLLLGLDRREFLLFACLLNVPDSLLNIKQYLLSSLCIRRRVLKKINSMHLIGLTGGIGSGKSTVCGYFKELGCAIIDADEIARKGT